MGFEQCLNSRYKKNQRSVITQPQKWGIACSGSNPGYASALAKMLDYPVMFASEGKNSSIRSSMEASAYQAKYLKAKVSLSLSHLLGRGTWATLQAFSSNQEDEADIHM